MRPTRTFVVSLAVLIAAAGEARAQETLLPPPHPGAEPWPAVESERPVWIEGFVSRQRGDAVGRSAEGMGGRVLWSLERRDRADAPSDLVGRLADRVAVGAFALRTRPAGRLEAWYAGAHADGRLVARPLLGRLEPLVSFSVGAYRERTPARLTADVPVVVFDRSLAEATRVSRVSLRGVRPPATAAHGAFAPGAALRLRLLRGVAIRGDARRLFVIDDHSPREALELAAGVSVAR